jgi:hypothetical protein
VGGRSNDTRGGECAVQGRARLGAGPIGQGLAPARPRGRRFQGCQSRAGDAVRLRSRRRQSQYAKFTRADLRGANLAYANLKGVDFSGADLAGADFTGAVLEGANFTDARGLDSAHGLQQGFSGDSSTTPSNN